MTFSEVAKMFSCYDPNITNSYSKEGLYNSIHTLKAFCLLRKWDEIPGGVHQTNIDTIYRIVQTLRFIQGISPALEMADPCCWEIGMGVPTLSLALSYGFDGATVVANDLGRLIL